MEVWWIGADGSIQDANWYASRGWQGFTLAGPNAAALTGSIAAVSGAPYVMEVV